MSGKKERTNARIPPSDPSKLKPEPGRLESGKIDWAYQIKYFAVMLVGIVAVLAILRFLGFRG